MKLMLLMSLAYVCGEHGFALFAPYLALFLPAAFVLWRGRREAVPLRVRTHQIATRPTRET